MDEEDFPKADIDIYQVRQIRSQVAQLQTDHTNIMHLIEKQLVAMHQAK